ncbi:MAG: hypothetical protein ACRD2B_08610 [Terriglobia bacterium]
MNIWSETKLNHMHNDPVKRDLVGQPGELAVVELSFSYREDASILAMDRTA